MISYFPGSNNARLSNKQLLQERTPKESSFFQKYQNLGLGRQIGPKNVEVLLVFSAKLQSTHLGFEYLFFFYKNLWISGLKHTDPKYDIGLKEFGR